MTWLIDPATREPLPAKPGERPPREHPAADWVFERDEQGIPVRMRWHECQCPKHQAEIDAMNARIESGEARR